MLGSIRKVLVANRGEIALRVIRACKDLGLETVAVYSKADEQSLPVKLADEAVCIGPPHAKLSYLNIPSIIAAAELTDADALHPGYGFLSEDAEFARICEACTIKFIGPTSKSIALLGNKIQARKIAKKANLPLLPGTQGVVRNVEEAAKEAEKIGYPVILKASCGGGGRGITIVHSKDAFKGCFERTGSEAKAAFGNGDLFIEKFCENARHVEIQIACDQFGNMIHLGERDCSIQRRHQKLIEEAPCPIINDDIRQRMSEAALRLAKESKYQNVGTVEFLLDMETMEFYFLEMNTRIQVEHPISEAVTGVDIVKLQLLIAANLPLPFEQSDISIKGHAIECRINAEDPQTFQPCPGTIEDLHVPGGVGVRFDSSIYNDYTVPPFYDSMIAKLITTEATRELAIKKMLRALSELKIEGIKTNSTFHTKVLKNENFNNNKYGVNFLNDFLENK